MLKLTNIHYSTDSKVILDGLNLNLGFKQKVALVGANGCGKTTTLKLILGQIKPDYGQVEAGGSIAAYVPQVPTFGATIIESFADTESWRAEIALEKVGLKLPLETETTYLSGGQKTKLSLAVVLATDPEPNLLLLDEPTNNLDRQSLDWLESFVKSFRGSIIIISHDRHFIDKTCKKVFELKDGKVSVYSGNYGDYKAQKDLELELEQQQVQYESYISDKNRLTSSIKSAQANMGPRHIGKGKGQNDNDKSLKGYLTDRLTKQKSNQLKHLRSKLIQLDDVDRPEVIKSYDLNLSGRNRTDKLILKLDEITLTYAPGLIEPMELELRGSQRLSIEGPNGSGKTCLLKIITGQIQPSSGQLKLGHNINLGYLSQDTDGLNHSKTGLENLTIISDNVTGIHRQTIALGLTPEDLTKRVDSLSRGQQTKIAFAKLLLSNNDLLILDEPTNHLDISSRENIEAALQDYHGAIIVASHDRYFLDSIRITDTLRLDS